VPTEKPTKEPVEPTATATVPPAPIEGVSISAICGYVGDTHWLWRVTNDTDADVEYRWRISGTEEGGSGTVSARGVDYFPTRSGDITVRLYVNGEIVDSASSEPPCKFPLELHYVCAAEGLEWYVFNPNTFDVEFTWRLNDVVGDYRGLDAGESRLVTTSGFGKHQLEVVWRDQFPGYYRVTLTANGDCPVDKPTRTPTLTATSAPTRTPTLTSTPTVVLEDTPTPTVTSTPLVIVEDTPTPTLTNTPVPPTNTPVPPTNTPVTPTSTPLIIVVTETPAPPTQTPVPPTQTPIPPTQTPIIIVVTATPEPVVDTPTPQIIVVTATPQPVTPTPLIIVVTATPQPVVDTPTPEIIVVTATPQPLTPTPLIVVVTETPEAPIIPTLTATPTETQPIPLTGIEDTPTPWIIIITATPLPVIEFTATPIPTLPQPPILTTPLFIPETGADLTALANISGLGLLGGLMTNTGLFLLALGMAVAAFVRQMK
jgi:hypothetical protein